MLDFEIKIKILTGNSDSISQIVLQNDGHCYRTWFYILLYYQISNYENRSIQTRRAYLPPEDVEGKALRIVKEVYEKTADVQNIDFDEDRRKKFTVSVIYHTCICRLFTLSKLSEEESRGWFPEVFGYTL